MSQSVVKMSSREQAIKTIVQAGFRYMKLELEAQLNRPCDEGSYEMQDCYECGGSGDRECIECEGNGYIDCSNDCNASDCPAADNEHRTDCDNCAAEGYLECSDCEGSGEREEYVEDAEYGLEWCENYLLDNVSRQAREQATKHMHFYNDGSVDSEATITLDLLSHPEASVEYIEAFRDMADEIGEGLDTAGAGMHITLLTDERYPIREQLPADKIRNFKRQVSKLLPALYFCASVDNQSRRLGFRHPEISADKYNEHHNAVAICTHNDTCIEYRLFETCYQKPEAIYDYLKVIANTLVYYINPGLRLAELNKEFSFVEDSMSLSRFYDTPEQLRVLNAQIKYVKPQDKTFKQLKRERNFNATVKSLQQKQTAKRQEALAEYRRYNARRAKIAKEIRDKVNEPQTKDQLYRLALSNGIGVSTRDKKKDIAKAVLKYGVPSRRLLRDFIQSNTPVAKVTV